MDRRLDVDAAAPVSRKILLFILALFGVWQLFIFIANHYFLRTYAFDFSAYNFAFYDYAHLRISPCPIYLFPYPVSFLQDHFSLTLMFFAPLYWSLHCILGSYTLLFIQWCVMIYGAWATYQLICLKTDNQILPFWGALYYFILLGRFSSVNGDCNLAIIGSAMIPVFLYYFEKQKMAPAVICFLFLIFNREDYALWLIFIFIFLMILHRKDKSKLKLSVGFLFLSLLFFVVIFKFIIPGLEDENKKYSLFNFAVLGKTPTDALLFILHHPLRALELLFVNHSGNAYYDGVKKEFYWVYFLSGGFLLLVRPVYLVPFVPLIAKKMYNDEPVRWGIEAFYSVEIVSILPVMVFLIIAGFRDRYLKTILASLICFMTMTVTIFEFAKMPDVKKFNFLDPAFYQSEYNIKDVYAAMRLIPDTAAVSASAKLSPHLSLRKKTYYFPKVDDADYVFLLKQGDSWPISPGEQRAKVEELITKEGWQLLKDTKDFWLLHKAKKS